MKKLVVYSTISGNTKAVCERVFNVLNEEKKIVNVKEIKDVNLEEYEDIIIGFWCDKGTMDKDSIKFVESISNKNTYFLGTLGANPNTESGAGHWNSLYENAKNLCSKNNNFKDGILIWGRVSQDMMDRMKKFPQGHPHAPTPERIANWKSADSHPDENDFKKAEEFFLNLLKK